MAAIVQAGTLESGHNLTPRSHVHCSLSEAMNTEDRIVISGISGRLPESNNVEEFAEYLFSGVDLVTEDDRRWTPGLFGTSAKNGKLKNIKHFDASFFGIHSKLANVMDPQGRLLLEVCHEAIVDAGINPQNIRGSRVGVFIGSSHSESLDYWCSNPERVDGYDLIGCSKSMISNRVSFTFDFTGPSYSVDCDYSSGIMGLQNAFTAIQTDQCDAAIVGGVNLCLMPTLERQYQKRNMISQKGYCSVFDEMGDGFVRSEAVVVLFIQKRCDALRLYATIINIKTNSDGYKPKGITFPSSERQKQLIRDVYSEVAVDPAKVTYVEAHGTGSKDADCIEANAIDEVFCADRDSPLLIGSVKSNVGHTEAASGLTAILKVILSMENEMIPPNIHFKKPNSQIFGLLNGRLKVVDKLTRWHGGLAGINCFGIGGSNVHVLLDWNNISKAKTPVVDYASRIVVLSGRTEDGVNKSLEKIERMPINDEFISLLYKVHQNNITGHNYRGFTLLGDTTPVREVSHYNGEKRPVWFVFSGMGSQWAGMAKDMMKLPVFRDSIMKCAEALKPEGVNLFDVVIDSTEDTFKNIINPFIGNAAVQIALVDVLRSVGIIPDGIVGHSTGEIGCAYADGTLTAEQTMLVAYYRGKSVIDTKLPLGAMAAVGLSFENVKKRIPPELDIACNNSRDNVTISGPAQDLRKFVKSLQGEGIFTKEVYCSEISLHSRYIAPAAPLLEKRLKEVIPSPKKRSGKWISSSVTQSMRHTPLAQYSSAEYHVNNLLSPVLFQEAVTHIPDNAIVIEVGPHCLLQAILKRSLSSSCTNIGLMKKIHPNNIAYLFSSFGKMYNVGLNPDLSVLHPTVSYPVSRGTPMIAPLVDWDHSEEWTAASYEKNDTSWIGERTEEININNEEHEFLSGHVIDGRILFPAMGLLELVWKIFASMNKEKEYHNFPVVFEDLKFQRVIVISKEAPVKFQIKIFDGTGAFEVCTSGSLAVSGRINAPDNIDKEMLEPFFRFEERALKDYPPLTSADIYKDLEQRGYYYRGAFKGIANTDNQCLSGELTWNRNWVTFIETMLQFSIMQKNSRELLLPKMIQKIIINTGMQNVLTDGNLVPVHFYQNFGITKAGGVEIHRLETSIIPRVLQDINQPKLEKCCFIPYNNVETELRNIPVNECALPVLLQIVLENVDLKFSINSLALADMLKTTKPLFERVVSILKETEPMINVQCTVVCSDTQEYSAYNYLPCTTFLQYDSAAEEFATKDIHLILVSNTQNSFPEKLKYFQQLMKDGAFVLVKDSALLDATLVINAGMDIVSVQRDTENVYTLLRKPKDFKNNIIVQMTGKNFSWSHVLRNELKEAEKNVCRIILECRGEVLNGIVGFVQCIRQEPGGQNVRCMFIPGTSASEFSNVDSMFMSQLKKDLTVNVYFNGQWGSYRHIKMADFNESTVTEIEHAYVDVMNSGDLESLRWVESPLTHYVQQANSRSKMCSVYYAPINFEDVMFATGKLNAEDYTAGFGSQKCTLGLEFSGRDQSGCRVMGLVDSRGLATSVIAESGFLWKVPESWSLEEAATVPLVYAASYYALIIRGRMKPGETLLVHAGSGGVGQASISIALHMGVTVFTTVGTPEKRNFLKHRFPQLTDNNIFNSRDTTFEKYVMSQTKGRGVDLVLNSLAEDKLQASVRCLANGGRFLQIGKFDIINNNPLGTSVFLKNTAFHAINFKSLIGMDRHEKREIVKLFTAGIKSGAVRPLPRTIFSHYEVGKAFRYMETGKHIGKVMLKIRTEEPEKVVMPIVNLVPAIPRIYMFPHKVYIVTEGLSDTGLQLAEWLVHRGATKIVFTSRTGIKTGYQYLCIRRWRELGITVLVSTENFSTEEHTFAFIKDAIKMGDIGGIFNISWVLRNDVFENLAEEKFDNVIQSTVNLTKNLDTISRLTCPKLDHFVVFSSVLRDNRNHEQPTYGLANSLMERICEDRQAVGLPALAVQWGAIGDVNLVVETMSDANNNRATFTQHISSCLHTLDILLRQTHPVVSSFVMVEKEVGPRHREILDGMANFLGIQEDVEELKPPKKTLVKLASKAEKGSDKPPLFLVHPMKGVITSLEPLAAELPLPVWGLQCTPEAPLDSINHLAAFYVQHVKRLQPNGPYNLGGYSFGATVAFEMALQLEKMGKQVTLILIDGSPSWLSAYVEHLRPAYETSDSKKDEFLALAYLLSQYLDIGIREVQIFLRTISSWDELTKLLARRSPCSMQKVVSSVNFLHKSIVADLAYTPKEIFTGSVVLFKAMTELRNLETDDKLSKVCKGRFEVFTLDSSHKKILQKSCIKKMAPVINFENTLL